MGFVCNYEASSNAAGNVVASDWFVLCSLPYFQSLTAPDRSTTGFAGRLHCLEEMVQKHDELLQHRDASQPLPNNQGIWPYSGSQTRSTRQRTTNSMERASLNQVVLQEEAQDEVLTDGMAITFVNEDDSGFFGV